MRRVLGTLSLFCVVAITGCPSTPPITVPDTGPRDAPVGGTDTPTGGTDTPSTDCPPVMWPAPMMPDACAATTLTCLMGAMTQDAVQACLDADPNAMACQTCLQDEAFNTCSTGTGTCADEVGLFECCLQDACPTGDAACINSATTGAGACVSAVNTLVMCVNTDAMARRCGNSPTLCFADAAGFFPDFGRPTHLSIRYAVETIVWSGHFAD